MNLPPDLYEDITEIYIQVIRKSSPDAAKDIDQVVRLYGGRVGLRAALIITLFKIEVQQHGWIPGIKVYAHLLEEAHYAVPLVKHAMECCLMSWDIPIVEVNDWLAL